MHMYANFDFTSDNKWKMTVVNTNFNIIQGTHVNRPIASGNHTNRRGNNWQPRNRRPRGAPHVRTANNNTNAQFRWFQSELQRQSSAMRRYRRDAEMLRHQLRRANQAARARNDSRNQGPSNRANQADASRPNCNGTSNGGQSAARTNEASQQTSRYKQNC